MSGFVKTLTERELEILRHRLDELEKRVDSLGASLPPGSDSALRETYCDRMWRAQTHRFDSQVPEGKISATFVLSDQEYQVLLNTPLPTSGPPTPDLAAQPDSNKKTPDSLGSTVPPGSESALRGEIPTQEDEDYERWQLQGNLARTQGELQRVTADRDQARESLRIAVRLKLKAQGELDAAIQHVKILQESRDVKPQGIGVYDYASCVSCLRTNYKIVFGEDSPLTDPQDMIQRMAAEIQGLRRELAAIRSQA